MIFLWKMMNREKEVGEAEERMTQTDKNSKMNPAGAGGGGSPGGGGGGGGGKSCKGYLYYSSTLKSHGTNPRCVGIPRTLPQVPNYVISQSEAEASKEGRTLVDFYYACAGYSVYANKNHVSHNQASKTELPVCVGLELLVDRKASGADSTVAASQAHSHSKEDSRELPLRRPHSVSHSAGDDFISRFTKNANLVASGVAKNLRRVGAQIKSAVDDLLYPFRRPPK